MKKNRIISSIISTCLLLNPVMPLKTNAISYSRLVDNDPIASGYSFVSNNMNYYGAISGSYNNDMRLPPLLNGLTAYAFWKFPPMSHAGTSCSATLGVYLNNINFTEPHAAYSIEIDNSSGGYDYMGSIDQYYAASGWNYIHKTVNAYSYNNYISCGSVLVESRTSGNVQLGADAVSLQLVF